MSFPSLKDQQPPLLWSCTENVILTFNRLESIEVQYMDANPGMFSSKTLIDWRKKYLNILDDMGEEIIRTF